MLLLLNYNKNMQLQKITCIDDLAQIGFDSQLLAIHRENGYPDKLGYQNTFALQGAIKSFDHELGYLRVMLGDTAGVFKHHNKDDVDLDDSTQLLQRLKQSKNRKLFFPLLIENFDEWEIYKIQ